LNATADERLTFCDHDTRSPVVLNVYASKWSANERLQARKHRVSGLIQSSQLYPFRHHSMNAATKVRNNQPLNMAVAQ